MIVAVLFVDPRGSYSRAPLVDLWPVERDARRYAGPHRVVAHPPCERWGRFWPGRPGVGGFSKGDDGGCFASALASVRRWGGVLEHPAGSAAWRAFDLVEPPSSGGWVAADWLAGCNGWACCVDQGWYGHAAPKSTWLYACGVDLVGLRWGRVDPVLFRRVEDLSRERRRRTPVPFRDLLLSLVRGVS